MDDRIVIDDKNAFASVIVIFGLGDDHSIGLFHRERRERDGLVALDVHFNLIREKSRVSRKAISRWIQHGGKGTIGSKVFIRNRHGFDLNHNRCVSLLNDV